MTTTRAVYGYTLHGRTPSDVLDYSAFFAFLTSQPATDLQTAVGDEVVAITGQGTISGLQAFRFVRGREGIPPLTYDPATGTETYEEIGERVLVSASWAFFDPVGRFAAVERRRPGVGANQVALALSHLGRELGFDDGLTISLHPVTERTFLDELNSFDRIREAEVEVSRPNLDWTDNAATLTEYADDSNAGSAAIRLKAERAGSLDQQHGIVQDIRQLVSDRFSSLRNARVVGKRQGEDRETSLSLRRFHAKRFATLPDNATAGIEYEQLGGTAGALISEMAADEDDATGK